MKQQKKKINPKPTPISPAPYNPRYDAAELAHAIKKGTRAWAGVPSRAETTSAEMLAGWGVGSLRLDVLKKKATKNLRLEIKCPSGKIKQIIFFPDGNYIEDLE